MGKRMDIMYKHDTIRYFTVEENHNILKGGM
jgi:hypothetical protein